MICQRIESIPKNREFVSPEVGLLAKCYIGTEVLQIIQKHTPFLGYVKALCI